MLKQVINYEDYDGTPRTWNAYFNLNNSELVKFLMTDGDYTLDKQVMKLFSERNGKKIMEVFDNLIDISYGVKSLDGIQFSKSPEILRKFKESLAYDKFFMELVTDAGKAADFFNSIVPKDTADRMRNIMEDNSEALPDEIREYLPNNQNEGK